MVDKFEFNFENRTGFSIMPISDFAGLFVTKKWKKAFSTANAHTVLVPELLLDNII